MIFRYIFIIFINCVCICGSAFAQTDIRLKGRVKGKIINAYTGELLVLTSKATYGVPTENPSSFWKTKPIVKVDASSYREVSFSSFVIFETKRLLNSKLVSGVLNSGGTSIVIINVNNGKVLFDSKNEGFKSVNKTLVLPERKSVLINGVKGRELTLALFDCLGNKMVWEITLDKDSFISAAKRNLLSAESVYVTPNDQILWQNYSQFVKVDVDTGEVLNEFTGVEAIEYDSNSDILLVFSDKIKAQKLSKETAVFAYRAADMQPAWKDTLLLSGDIYQKQIVDGQVVTITSRGFNIIDLNKGKKAWQKTETLPLIKKISPVPGGYLVAQENYLTLVDTIGKKVWEKTVKISRLQESNQIILESDSLQAIAITPSFATRIRLKDGSEIWKNRLVLSQSNYLERNLELKDNTFRHWFDPDRKRVLVFSNNRLFGFDIADTLRPEPYYRFEDDITDRPQMEIRKNGYFLYRRNRFYFIDKNGQTVYQKLYNKSESPFWDKTKDFGENSYQTYKAALLFIPRQINNTFKSLLVSQDLGIVTGFTRFVYGNYQMYMGLYDQLTDINPVALGSSLEAYFKRTEIAKSHDDYLLLAAKTENGYRVVKHYKENGKGEVMEEIITEADDVMFDQALEILYLFGRKKLEVHPLAN